MTICINCHTATQWYGHSVDDYMGAGFLILILLVCGYFLEYFLGKTRSRWRRAVGIFAWAAAVPVVIALGAAVVYGVGWMVIHLIDYVRALL